MAAIVIYPGAFDRIIRTDPRTELMCRAAAADVIDQAKHVFELAQRHDNEARTSEFTPPKYALSFRLRKIRAAKHGFAWQATNDDPGAMLVEYGAHAGGRTFVLRYKPLTRGLDIVATKNAGSRRL